jgi:hypothetical protein
MRPGKQTTVIIGEPIFGPEKVSGYGDRFRPVVPSFVPLKAMIPCRRKGYQIFLTGTQYRNDHIIIIELIYIKRKNSSDVKSWACPRKQGESIKRIKRA